MIARMSAVVVVVSGLVACSGESEQSALASPAEKAAVMPVVKKATSGSANPDRNVYFGDLHVHTAYSSDAFAFGTLATPYDAYRFAKGEAIEHPAGFDMQLDQPLDFYAVTDHASLLGLSKEAANTATEFSKYPLMKQIHNLNAPENLGLDSIPARAKAFRPFLGQLRVAMASGDVPQAVVQDVIRSAWDDEVEAADEHYQPGTFTTFAAYEFTTSKRPGSLHRNVIFRSTENIPDMPYSVLTSPNPEDLWTWMDERRGEGTEILAIPHNSNMSNGQMFELATWAGDPMNAQYSAKRSRNEPLVEITQIKGTSETHPALSSRDEWAGFEISPFSGGTAKLLPSKVPGSYVREALKNGLSLEAQGLGNPFKYGFIGSSDTHTGAGSYDESNFFSKAGLLDSTPTLRGSVPLGKGDTVESRASSNSTEVTIYTDAEGRQYNSGKLPTWGAAGLVGVWAEQNTREAIYDALKHKETFATSGPRIPVRFFAGADLKADMLETPDGISRAYANGTAMGGDLVAQEGAPAFLVWAVRDANSAPLQRLQIIKGWHEEDGKTNEKVFDVACSDGLAVDPNTHRCPDNGARVDASSCAFSSDVGAVELKTLWRDPGFDAQQRAFYYVRVLENPTCRWSTWDALRAGVEPRDDLPRTVQERSWSSPIWYTP
ncbi:MAG: DUF3604 domain-containing protein [Halieaceae bacterium]|nr:DUF3604 domain-containing protein [Halieaceae bacterium]